MLKIGKYVNTHGIKGEIRILSNFSRKDLIFIPNFKIYIKDKEFIIKSYRAHKNYDMLILDGINNINDIINLKGNDVYINRNDINENKSNITSIWDKINSGINIKPATKTELGVIKVGNSLMIDTDGTLNIYLAYLQSEILNMLLKENTDLLTTNKTIIGAINELKTMLDELKGQSTKSYFDESFNNTTGELTFVGHNSEVTYDDTLGALNFIGGTVNYNSETGELVII